MRTKEELLEIKKKKFNRLSWYERFFVTIGVVKYDVFEDRLSGFVQECKLNMYNPLTYLLLVFLFLIGVMFVCPIVGLITGIKDFGKYTKSFIKGERFY